MKTILQKMASRKFIAALLAFAGALILIFAGDRLTADAADYLERGVSALCVYIGGESLVDAANVFSQNRKE